MLRFLCLLVLACPLLAGAEGGVDETEGTSCKWFTLPSDREDFKSFAAEVLGDSRVEKIGMSASFCTGGVNHYLVHEDQMGGIRNTTRDIQQEVNKLRRGRSKSRRNGEEMEDLVKGIRREMVQIKKRVERTTDCGPERNLCLAAFHTIGDLGRFPVGQEECLAEQVCTPLLECSWALHKISATGGCLDEIKKQVCQDDGPGQVKVCCDGTSHHEKEKELSLSEKL